MQWMQKVFLLGFIATFSVTGLASTEELEAVPGEYVVEVSLPTTLGRLTTDEVEGVLGLEVSQSLKPDHSLLLVKRSVVESMESVVATLENNDYIVTAEPNYIYKLDAVPNDPMFNQLWGLQNKGQKDPKNKTGKAGFDVDAVRAWEITTGSKDVVVGIIDTGIDYTHPDLAANMWVNELEKNGQEGVDDDGNGYVDDIYGYDFIDKDGDPKDEHSHGTHVAGTIGGVGNDGQGVVGVNWNVRMMAVKIFNAQGRTNLAAIVPAIDYATLMGARLTNNSWGGGRASKIMKAAIERANRLGVLFIAAAGNSNVDNDQRPHYPSSYDSENIIAVASIENGGVRSSFSCYGEKSVDIAAPGTNILSTVINGKYASYSGTSMATPHVAGVAALLLAKEPNLSGAQVKERLLKTAVPKAALRGVVSTGGMVNAFHALIDTVPAPDKDDPFNWQKQSYEIALTEPTTNKAWIVNAPGAKRMALGFEFIKMTGWSDSLNIYDAKTGEHIQKIGRINRKNIFSKAVNSDSLILIFQSSRAQTEPFKVNNVAVDGNAAAVTLSEL